MSCRLKDYYKEGVPLDMSLKIISGLIDQKKDIVDNVLRDYSSLNLVSRNLESLGFLDYTHPPAAPIVTTRGGTLIVSGRPYVVSRLKKSVPMEMGRFVLLKAVRDSDWECFHEFYRARYIDLPEGLTTKKAVMDHIRWQYYPQFSRGNMNHWYELHASFAKETHVDKIAKRKNSRLGADFSSLDPYSEKFAMEEFFGRSMKKPATSELESIVEEALSIYRVNLLESSFVGHCETLKTLVQALLLTDDFFETEIPLGDRLITILKKKGISLMRSNYPALTEGHGLIDSRGTEQTSFKLFSL